MTMSDRRQYLRMQTGPVHQELDELVGNFDTIDTYRRYVGGMLRFRQAIELQIAASDLPRHGLGSFKPSFVASELRQDYQALIGPDLPPSSGEELPPLDASALFGTLYVLEGSSLGARLLWRRAKAIGLDETNGAAHLLKQSADKGNWNAFCALLLTADNVDCHKMADAASIAFNRALHAFGTH